MYNIGYKFLSEQRYRLLDVAEFPKSRVYETWKKWAYPIKNVMQTTSEFQLFKDFDTPVADCRLFYEEGRWVITVKREEGTWTINSRTKKVTVEEN